jgi:hypothetical protein
LVRFSCLKWGGVKAPFLFTNKVKFIEEISEYLKIDSILVTNKLGHLQRLQCSFLVEIIQNVGDLQKGLICLVNTIKIDLSIIDVYIIQHKASYYFTLRVLGSK